MDLIYWWWNGLIGKQLAIFLSHACAFPSILPYFWPLVLKACLPLRTQGKLRLRLRFSPSPWPLTFSDFQWPSPPLLVPKPNWRVPALLFPGQWPPSLCPQSFRGRHSLSKSHFTPVFARHSVEKASVSGFAFSQASSVLDKYLHFPLTGSCQLSRLILIFQSARWKGFPPRGFCLV